jgi:N utilization substance protein A
MAVTGISANRLELLQIANAVAQEKNIDREIVIEALEEAIQKGAKSRYGAHHDIRARIDPKTGELALTRHVTIVEDDWQPEDELEEFNDSAMVRVTDASKRDPEAVVGKEYVETLPPFEIGRVQTQMARQVVMHKVREAERERSTKSTRIAPARSSTAASSASNTATSSSTWAVAKASCAATSRSRARTSTSATASAPTSTTSVRETKGPQIMLSRAHGGFMAKLFAQEVPEVYDGVIEIRAVARDPGSRAKMAVISNDSSIDPVGACVGMRGSRVQAVVAELQGEKIDIIQWSRTRRPSSSTAWPPPKSPRSSWTRKTSASKSWCPTSSCRWPSAVAARTSAWPRQLTGWQIDIMTESQESERRQKQFTETTALFQEALDVDEVIAQLLVTEGFATVEDVAYVEPHEIAAIEGFDDETADELQTRAREFLEKEAAALDAKRVELGVEDEACSRSRASPCPWPWPWAKAT